ncbi:MAG: hypothetical protein GTO54_13055, partial [Nitrososphaeria archaeon]|nr:hypothetical protein [Nitrososphaeria archaeon]
DGGVQVLEEVLRDAPSYDLRWVFCNDEVYEKILVKSGFTLIDRLNNGVSVWEKGDVPPIQNDEAVGETTIITYIRGIAPISLLIVSLVLILRLDSDNKTSSKTESA